MYQGGLLMSSIGLALPLPVPLADWATGSASATGTGRDVHKPFMTSYFFSKYFQ